MRKVIYIAYQKISDKFKEDFFINKLVKEEISFEYWDLSKMYSRNFDLNQPKYVISISNLNQLRKKIKENDIRSTVFVIHITYSGNSLKLYRLLTKLNCFIVYISRNPILNPLPTNKIKLLQHRFKFRTALILINPKKSIKIINNYLALYYKHIGLVKPFDIVFSAAEKGIEYTGIGWEIDLKKSKIIPVNSVDYEKSKNIDSAKKLMFEKYAVFLDQNLPFHPDFEILQHKTISYEEYYNNLNKFFRVVEKEYTVKVVIAGHPKTNNREINFFRGRNVFYDVTAKLVKSSEFVITHGSTAINYAVIYDKPIIFITSNQIKKTLPSIFYYTLQLGRFFNQHIYNISENNFDIVLSKLNHRDKIKYMHGYITSDTTLNYDSGDLFLKQILNS